MAELAIEVSSVFCTSSRSRLLRRASSIASAAATVCTASSRLAMYLSRAPVPNSPVYTQGPEIASSTALTAVTLSGSPEAKVVASRGATMPGLPLIGQSSRSPPLARTSSRSRILRGTSMVLISMWIVPGRRALRVPGGPPMTSSTSAASGTMDSSTSAPAATSAAEPATMPPASASSDEPLRR